MAVRGHCARLKQTLQSSKQNPLIISHFKAQQLCLSGSWAPCLQNAVDAPLPSLAATVHNCWNFQGVPVWASHEQSRGGDNLEGKLKSGKHQQKVMGNNSGNFWMVLPAAEIIPAKTRSGQAKMNPICRQCLLQRHTCTHTQNHYFLGLFSSHRPWRTEEKKKKAVPNLIIHRILLTSSSVLFISLISPFLSILLSVC